MLEIILFFLITSLIGLPFYWLYKIILKKNKITLDENQKNAESITGSEISDLIVQRQYLFMEDYEMWQSLSDSEKKDRLKDIQVIFDYGKNQITRAMIEKGFQPGSKIIDIKYFTGLSQFGTTISSFLIQHEDGGEIRELTINIDMDKMKFIPIKNHFYSNGKEKYWYLKDKNKELMKM
jgi:hypothetical protein